jgi:hypothetical protein
VYCLTMRWYAALLPSGSAFRGSAETLDGSMVVIGEDELTGD